MNQEDICPNCHESAPGGLYSTGPRGHSQHTSIVHCGCYYHGDPTKTDDHASRDETLWKQDDIS